ncbi:MAG: peptidoglycan-associated lipoprotein Pal [Steroidobacteraceae bacterium]|jgi:peptidoglycan-associated lipoprotein|nr:peptidoglycan-associated lipoprotein Pal [Steroidobacteraceae bacterium]
MRNLMWIWLAAGALAIGGCATKKPVQKPATETSQGAEAGAGSQGAGSGEGVTTAPLGDDTASAGPQGELLSKRIIYFEFDRAELKPEDETLIAAHARYLASHPGTRVRLEGHTDERGTREYNIGLGERRAQTVRRALLLQGVAETQVATVSYGEERPAAAGSDEVAWAQNRRVEIVYLN